MRPFSYRGFLKYAEKLHNDALESPTHSRAIPYLIGSVLTSWMALESFVNNMMEDFTTLPEGSFSIHESAFLKEKQVQFNTSGSEAGRFSIGKNSDFKRLEDKILFLIAKFGDGKVDKGGPLWQKFEKVKKKRNALSHFRREFDIELTAEDSEEAFDLVKELIVFVSKKVWKKPVKW